MAEFNKIKKELDYREYCENNSEVLKTFYEILEQYPNNDENKEYYLEGNLPETYLQLILETHSILKKEWKETFEIRTKRYNMPWEKKKSFNIEYGWKIESPPEGFNKYHLDLLKKFQSFLTSKYHYSDINNLLFNKTDTEIKYNNSDWYDLSKSDQNKIIETFFSTLYLFDIPVSEFYYFNRKGKYGVDISWKKYTFKKYEIVNPPLELDENSEKFSRDYCLKLQSLFYYLYNPKFKLNVHKKIKNTLEKGGHKDSLDELYKNILSFDNLGILSINFGILKLEVKNWLNAKKITDLKNFKIPTYNNNKIIWRDIFETKGIESEKNNNVEKKS